MIALDIETRLPERRGFNKYYNPSDIKRYDNCRIVSIGLYSTDFEKYSIIKPNGFTIKNSNFHGITQATAEKEGISLQEFFDKDTLDKLKDYEVVVGHNLNFDLNVLKSEMIRHGLSSTIFPERGYCTMKEGQLFLGQMKLPKLTDLYYHLFRKDYLNAHNAFEDAKASYLCYTAMCKC